MRMQPSMFINSPVTSAVQAVIITSGVGVVAVIVTSGAFSPQAARNNNRLNTTTEIVNRILDRKCLLKPWFLAKPSQLSV